MNMLSWENQAVDALAVVSILLKARVMGKTCHMCTKLLESDLTLQYLERGFALFPLIYEYGM